MGISLREAVDWISQRRADVLQNTGFLKQLALHGGAPDAAEGPAKIGTVGTPLPPRGLDKENVDVTSGASAFALGGVKEHDERSVNCGGSDGGTDCGDINPSPAEEPPRRQSQFKLARAMQK